MNKRRLEKSKKEWHRYPNRKYAKGEITIVSVHNNDNEELRQKILILSKSNKKHTLTIGIHQQNF